MVVIGYDLYSFCDPKYETNSYFILNSAGNYCFINPTPATFSEIEKKFEFVDGDELNIFFTSERPTEFDELIQYLLQNFCSSTINIYINDKKENVNNINFIQDFSRVQLDNLIINRIDLPGITKKAIALKYKENIFTGEAISTDFKYFDIEDEKLFKESVQKFTDEISEYFLVCSTYGEPTKKYNITRHFKKTQPE